MALIDYAQGKVQDGFKDENLEKIYGPKLVEILRRVPAEQRQNVLAEHGRRTTTTRFINSEGFDDVIKGVDWVQVYEDILSENGW